MGAFDKIVAAVSPRRACEREAWRQQLEILRGYDAAGYGRLNAGWRVHNESAEVTDRFSRDVVRARARDLERNSDIAQSILHAYKRNVVGKGYTLQAKTGNDELDEKLEKAWRQELRRYRRTEFQPNAAYGGRPQKGGRRPAVPLPLHQAGAGPVPAAGH